VLIDNIIYKSQATKQRFGLSFH